MKALVLTGKKQLEIEDIKEPEIKPDEVLIHTAYAGICGTDKALYAGLPGSASAVPPIVLGHENSGVVTKVGSEVTNVKPGDRVTVDPNIYCGQCKYCRTQRPELCEHLDAVGVTRNGGFEEYFTAPAKVVYPIPDDVSLKAAAVVEPISCAMHGVDLLETHPYQKALVLGDGFEGQLFAQILKARGIHEVTLAGRSDEKLENNRKHFGVKTINTTKEEIPADAYDIVVEAVGLPATQEQALAAAARGAQVLMFGVGNPDDKFSVNTYDVFQKQLTIQGAFINPYTFEDSIALLSSGVVDPLPLFSHELDLGGVEDFVSGKLGKVSKAVVKVGGEEA
ncbi:zinc-dependent alcohol dehydrogenase family protein [Limosilactobacillus reuteri]|uniref:zinc-dependent alcohol dehydrogenase family protein n=1 Tax=Limosilactobacillus reuteri TaxID=1598 RepID=UPI001E65CB9C|nr:zinc-dependent alcohol dehydrogenase family protein [Limosilactobacillus reuteri]MCC4436531.1 zinc-dependent alcohol dehydrogenase family protein [Limosilactobacillus reuteri]MCC4437778.1 zinc-dependent alcohol dehydrogenase family protein [Limosilactobacillus reuteri]MCC4441729.1 zinc-dependent alcohol dehydrogenase family protein [Limosilactobacillus reuteri]MCC4443735.1 zinc-dependent alcohol dehydrogenase family protein [Limosilactobacillus reuteri]MCC4445489.1 zinc-dependent alcohol de